jgi:ArsR family transcriptional regulator
VAPRRATGPAQGEECCAALTAAPLSDAEAADLAAAFAALADPVRLKLLSCIASAGDVCSCDLTEPLARSQSTVSHHTRVLADAGLISGERQGRWVHWSVVDARLATLRATLAPRE